MKKKDNPPIAQTTQTTAIKQIMLRNIAEYYLEVPKTRHLKKKIRIKKNEPDANI